MAKAGITIPDDFLEKLLWLGEKTDQIMPKVPEAGGEIVPGKVKSNLSAAVGRNTKRESRSTGELVGSLGLSPAKQKRYGSGRYAKAGFAEPRASGESNAKIANILEYGQPAKPFLKQAKSASKNAAIEAMKRKFEEDAGNV